MAVLDELLVRLGVDMSDAQAEVDEGAQGIEDRLNGLTVAGGIAAAGLGAAFVAGLGAAMDISSVTTQLQNQLNLTDEEAARAGTIAGDVFSAGFGESMGEVGEAVSAVSSSMEDFGSVSDKEMAQLTKSALGLAKTFNFDVNEAAAGAGNLIKAGLAKDGTEAMDLLAATAQKLPAAMREELPAVTKEYSEFFGQLGFTGPQMMGLLTEAAKNPAFEIDKMGDAIKEFTLQMADTGKVTEPLKELGLDVEHIQKLMDTGQGTKAFDEVNNALLKVTDQTKRTGLQAALFGGPGEDMGNTLQAIAEAGGTTGTKLGDVAGAAKRVTDNMEDDPAQQWNSVMRTVTTTLGEALLPALKFVSGLMKEHPVLLKIVIGALGALAVVLAVAAAAQFVMNSAILMSPITWIIIGILAVVAAIVVIATKTRWFQDLWNTVWGGIKAAASAVANWFTGSLVPKIKGAWNAVGKGASDMWRTVKGWWNTMMDWLGGIPGRISKAASGMWDAIPRAFKGAINGVIRSWNNLSFTIGGGSIMGVDIPSITLSTPNLPYLAKGGIATGPTLAMVGEGREDEAILPLSRLEQLLHTTRAPSMAKVAPAETRVVLEFRGGPSAFREFLQESVRTVAGGSIVKYAEG